jgi:Histidine kinase-, DNA gyrase B-, and HSP90-like ATPase
MSSALALTPPLATARPASSTSVSARLCVYAGPTEPPVVDELRDDDPAGLVEALCDAVGDRSPLPAPAIREVVDNLVHAGFRDAVVSILDGGFTVRVSDHGPGIDDPFRALQPGFSTAGPEARELVRGVGGGLPLAARLMDAGGGRLELADNLGGGAVVTLSAPAPDVPAPEPVCSEAARVILGHPARLAEELGRSRAECGRELATLQHRGLVAREPGGARRLTDSGAALVATLF